MSFVNEIDKLLSEESLGPGKEPSALPKFNKRQKSSQPGTAGGVLAVEYGFVIRVMCVFAYRQVAFDYIQDVAISSGKFLELTP